MSKVYALLRADETNRWGQLLRPRTDDPAIGAFFWGQLSDHAKWGGFWLNRAKTAGKRTLRGLEMEQSVLRGLQPGDHLLVLDLRCALFLFCERTSRRPLLDLVETLERFDQAGVTVHILDPELPSLSSSTESRAQLRRAAEAITALKQEMASTIALEAAAERRQKGKALNQHPGLGYRVAGRKGKRRRVADEAERQTMRQIADWFEEGYSWDWIYFHLLEQKVRTREGKEWSLHRIRRAYQAELRLRAQEAQQQKPEEGEGRP